ncbi:MAG: sulfatase-like hydrolase/transferase, partial [Deltaproteobacteria bacterium]|nr:sulfatase-like hydrolase/transferase [Deltaproteobacteria bacterium]
KNAADYDTFLLYMSDHGESLGEKGIYLHSLPYFMAPEEQKHIGAVIWLSESCARNRGVANLKTLLARREQPISHDHIFHSLLGIYHVRSTIYKPQLDIFHIDQSDVPWRGGLG